MKQIRNKAILNVYTARTGPYHTAIEYGQSLCFHTHMADI